MFVCLPVCPFVRLSVYCAGRSRVAHTRKQRAPIKTSAGNAERSHSAQYCESIACVTLHVATIYFNLAVKLHCYLFTLCLLLLLRLLLTSSFSFAPLNAPHEAPELIRRCATGRPAEHNCAIQLRVAHKPTGSGLCAAERNWPVALRGFTRNVTN